MLFLFLSCRDEDTFNIPKGTFVSFEIAKSSTQVRATHAGDYPADYIVHTLRIIAFDKVTGECKSNVRYNAGNGDVIHHPVPVGTYDFVFIANESNINSIKDFFDNLISQNYTYARFKQDAVFPSSSFNSDNIIPMKDEIDDVEILYDGSGAKIGGQEAQKVVPINLDRIGVRLDIFLRSKENLDEIFKGISLTGLPDKVPLYTLSYNGTVERTGIRKFTQADDGSYFHSKLPTQEESQNGIVWAKDISRIVVPASEFANTGDENNAVVFTVNMTDKYSPSSMLKIGNGNYTLPQNTKLDLTGIVMMPLEMNIQASPWVEEPSDWIVPETRLLNVSQLEASITDFNGVRISFWSNMPSVRILPEVIDLKTSASLETNLVFNDLAITDDNPNPTRFQYIASSGSGYMDILFDGGRPENGGASLNTPDQRSYRLILSAEDENGKNPLQREIIVNIDQRGVRPNFLYYDNVAYVGAFFRNQEVGERIISGQHLIGEPWTAEVIKGDDFIVLSSTPSFDPHVGTDNPGNPEKYLVKPNEHIQESGTFAKGKGRIYFRVGMKNKNQDTAPRYGIIKINYFPGEYWQYTDSIFVRQGEEPDWIYRNNDVITHGILKGNNRTSARKFAAYNLTSTGIKNGSVTTSGQINKKSAVFVDYPSQAGAFFLWASTKEDFIRRAYHPINSIPSGEVSNEMIINGFWNPTYKEENEVSPTGFSRPSDGSETEKVFNGPYTSSNVPGSTDPYGNYSSQIINSTVRTSLFFTPEAGNAYQDVPTNVKPTYPASASLPDGYSKALTGTREGWYADGFFDRRPLDITKKAVSAGNANIAYKGMLFFNPATAASLFIPLAGRRTTGGVLQYQGNTAYIWTTSVGPWYPATPYPVWSFEMAYYAIGPVSQVSGFAQSIRCIQGD